MKKYIQKIKFCLPILMVAISLVQCQSDMSNRKWDISDGYVPDSDTAVEIAQILFVRIYGKRVLHKKPFVATLKDGKIWVVDGTVPDGVEGGAPHLEIQKADGKILALYHYK